MIFRLLPLVFICALSAINLSGQTTAASIDSLLAASYGELQNPASFLTSDTAAAIFKRNMKQYLSSPLTFHHSLPGLGQSITIRQSPDKKVKFYSWNERTGGSWYEIDAFAQYADKAGNIHYLQLDTDREMEEGGFTDSEIYEVNEISENGQVYYISFALGTHGSGNTHQVVQVFTFKDDSLVRCPAFGDGSTELVMEYPRREKLNLQFDAQTSSLSFDEFRQKENETWAEKTGNRKTLRFSRGVFR